MNYIGELYKKNGLLYQKHRETKTGQSFNQLVIPKELRRQVLSVNHESAFSGHLRGKEDRSLDTPDFLLPKTMPGCHQILSFLQCMPENHQEG